ncbi:hypothetical protein IFM89_039697, partial [Coptis chinensis]
MAMATAAQLNLSSPSFRCNSNNNIKERFLSSVSFPQPAFSCSSISHESPPPAPCLISNTFNRPTTTNGAFRVFAVAEEQPLSASSQEENGSPKPPQVIPYQLYVCNLPRSCDISQLLDMFKPYGAVQSVEISRNTETGISKGCGYVTMASIDETIAAVTALDGSDVLGREMRVRLSTDMTRHKNIQILDSETNKTLIFETPHKIYVGNLAWSVKPDFLREFFTQFGTVVSVRVLYDRKVGKNRVYAFLSFSSAQEFEAAMTSDGKEILGRKMLVRKALKSTEFQEQSNRSLEDLITALRMRNGLLLCDGMSTFFCN